MELTKWSEALNNACKVIIDWLDLDWRDVESPRILVGSGLTIKIGPLTISEEGKEYSVEYLTGNKSINVEPIGMTFGQCGDSLMDSVIDLSDVIINGGLYSNVTEYRNMNSDKINDYKWDVEVMNHIRNLNWTTFKREGNHKIFYKSYDVLAEYDLSKITWRNPTDFNIVRLSGEVPVIRELFSDRVWLEIKRLEGNARIVGVSNCKKSKNGTKYAISVTTLGLSGYTHLNGLNEIRKFNESKKK